MSLKNILLGIAILILTIFVTFYGINTVFPKPDYEDLCPSQFTSKPLGCGPDEVNSFSNSSLCEQALEDLKCYDRYNDALKERSRKVFFLALPLGILILAVGAFFFGLESVGAGLMGGGIGTLIYGSGAYWPYTENWIRFALSLLGLVILIAVAYYFNSKYGKKKGKEKGSRKKRR